MYQNTRPVTDFLPLVATPTSFIDGQLNPSVVVSWAVTWSCHGVTRSPDPDVTWFKEDRPSIYNR